MENAWHSSTLSPQLNDHVDYMSRVLYSSAMGSFIYTMVRSRSDLLYTISGYMVNPGKEHWKVFQLIFMYLLSSTNVCSHFGKTRDGIIWHVDYDFAGNFDKMRSLTGYVFTIGHCAINGKLLYILQLYRLLLRLSTWLLQGLVRKLFG